MMDRTWPAVHGARVEVLVASQRYGDEPHDLDAARPQVVPVPP